MTDIYFNMPLNVHEPDQIPQSPNMHQANEAPQHRHIPTIASPTSGQDLEPALGMHSSLKPTAPHKHVL